MTARLLSFFAYQGVALMLGVMFLDESSYVTGSLIAALLGTYCWFLIDWLRAEALMAWVWGGFAKDVRLEKGIWSDIYARIRRDIRQRDQALEASDARVHEFLVALQESSHGVILLNDLGQIEWVNETACLHFGLDAKRDVMQHFANVVRDPAFIRYYAVQDFREDLRMAGRNSSDGRPVFLGVHFHAYEGKRMLLLSRDVTVLEQADAMRRDFVANVSHEIRTPLTVLSGFIETLQSLKLEESEREYYLGLMESQSKRMQSLVSDLLTLSKLEGSPLPPSKEWVKADDVLALCREDALSLSKLLGERSCPVQWNVQLGVEIAGTASELHSAMANLLTNAIRYTPLDKAIRVSWSCLADGCAEFVVEDSGPGIPAQHISRLTERFYRIDRSRSRDTGGTGLGLAIVKHVVQRHSAELKISSVVGQGSRFVIRFPAQRIRVRS